MNWLIVKH